MSIVQQPLAVLAPSSDADEGLPRSGSRSSLRASSSHDIEGVIGDDIADDGSGQDRSISLTRKDSAATSPQQKASVTKHVPIIYKELTPLVAMPPPSDAAVHSRLTKHGYSRLGRNLLFEARPAVGGEGTMIC